MHSIIQSDKVCFVTNSTNNLHKHHIFGGANRGKSEQYGLYVYLRIDWHIQTPYAVHNDSQFNLSLKRLGQTKFEEKYSRKEFMKIFKRSYL